jgi:hypothetical protein
MEAVFLSRIWAMVLMILLFVVGLSVGMPCGRTIQASEVEAVIRAGEPADFDNCTIAGDLNLSTLKIYEKVHFNHTVFQSLVICDFTTFSNTAYFESAIFNSAAYFNYSTFNSAAYFISHLFNSTADFSCSNFLSSAYFTDDFLIATLKKHQSEIRNHEPGIGYIRFDGANFNGISNFSSSNFNNDAYFGFSRFKSVANFSHSRFNGTADFGNSFFENSYVRNDTDYSENTYNLSKAADFSHSRFNNTAIFGSYFKRAADFRYSDFNRAYFWCSYYNDTADFRYSKFNDDADFMQSEFNSWILFDESNFNKDVDFSYSNFNYSAEFIGTNFNGTTSFEYSSFKDDALFRDVDFKDDALFRDVDFNGTANFENSKFNGKAIFYGSTFKKDLDLTFAEYNVLYIRWNKNNHLIYDDTAYQLFIENLRKLGFMADADNFYYQLRVEQFLNQNPIEDPLIFTLNLGAWIFYGFGKRPIYPFIWSIFFIGLFGIFWVAISLSSPKDAIKKYNLAKGWSRRAFSLFFISIISIIWMVVGLEKSRRAIDEYDLAGKWPGKIREALSFSATVFLSGTKLFVDPPVVPVLPGRSQSLIKRAFLFERLLGAFFSILLFLAIGATIIRN